eukprot:3940700-Rhodomonas_salina.3
MPAKTPVEPGVRLSKVDLPEPAFVYPYLCSRYRGITYHLSYLVTMTRCDLAFVYAELSKFVQCPGPVHLKAAKQVLSYVCCTYKIGLVYGYPGPVGRNVLSGCVDSDYASNPDCQKSVTGYVLSMNTPQFPGRQRARTA